MTHSDMFTCIATSKRTWQTKRFFSLIPGAAHAKAIRWLKTH